MDRRNFLQGTAATIAAVSVADLRAMPFSMTMQSLNAQDTSGGWWNRQPIRWIQTNLRETNAAMHPKEFVDQVVKFNANVLMMNAGGITAYYPTKIEYAYVSPYLPSGQDTFGEVLKEVHARGLRLVSRWDFSKTHKDVFDAHPEWFFKMSDGKPAIYNGLYLACINGDWYHKKSLEILSEALDRYDVDGCFFNAFSNPTADYSYHPLGLCHCDNCQRLYQARYHRAIPEQPDEDYKSFLHDSGSVVSLAIRDLIRKKRPKAAFIGGTPQICDIAYGEANTAVHRPLPLWPYSASDNTNQWRNSYPDKGVVCQGMSFVDFPWRFATVPQAEITTRIWQNVANGGAAAFNLHGTIAEQQDRTAVEVAVPAYGWLKEHEDYFVGQTNEARILLLAPGPVGVGFQESQDAYRGIFRLLTEQHIPFASVQNLDWLGKRKVDLVISPGPALKGLEEFVRNGGNMIVASAMTPEFEIAPVVKRWKDPDGAYFRVRDKKLFPSLKDIDVVFMYGDYLQVQGEGAITFMPPSMYGPPELVNVDWKDTTDPGLVIRKIGKGTVAWLPWDIGGLYYRHSQQGHAGIMTDLVDHLLPEDRDLRSNAHPLVEITLMRQKGRQLVQLVNLSGHSDTAYFTSLPMNSIEVQVKGSFSKAHAVRSGAALVVMQKDRFASFTLPALAEYELIELA